MSASERGLLISDKDRLSKIPFSCAVSICGASANIYTHSPELKRELSRQDNSYRMSIPGYSVNNSVSEGSDTIIVTESDKPGIDYNKEDGKLYLQGNSDMFKNGQPIAWLSYWLTEAKRQAKSLFTMHSSALSVDDKGILLIGHSGAGKTALMLDLCRRFDGEVVSNDLTIVGHDKSANNMTLVEGTKELRLRRTTVARNFPDLEPLFAGHQISPWEDKIVILPEDMGIKSAKVQIPISRIFEVHLDSDNNSNQVVEKAGGIGIKYRLYEDMSRIVRATAISVFDNSNNFLGYLPPLDTEELHKKRVDCIDCMTNRIGIISISGGNLNQISDSIIKMI